MNRIKKYLDPSPPPRHGLAETVGCVVALVLYPVAFAVACGLAWRAFRWAAGL